MPHATTVVSSDTTNPSVGLPAEVKRTPKRLLNAKRRRAVRPPDQKAQKVPRKVKEAAKEEARKEERKEVEKEKAKEEKP